MAERRDAGLTAVRLLARLDREFPMLCGPRTTWTCGRIALDPGAQSIIPGRAEVLFQFRDIEVPVLERLHHALERAVQEMNRTERTRSTLEVMSQSKPAPCDAAMQAALAEAAQRHANGQWQHMPSGAGHDAQYMARIMPAAMLFTPSINGISHHWAEDTKEEDLALNVRILADAAEAFLRG
jgi:N-carbamoyl-L-amino-acid hydrolase